MITKLITKVKGRQIKLEFHRRTGGTNFGARELVCSLSQSIEERCCRTHAADFHRSTAMSRPCNSTGIGTRPASIYPACQQENLGSLWRGASTSGCVNRVTIASHAETISLHMHETNSRYSRILLLADSTRTMTRTTVSGSISGSFRLNVIKSPP